MTTQANTQHFTADDQSYLYSYTSAIMPDGKEANMKWYQNGSGTADVWTHNGISDDNDVITCVSYGWAYPPALEQQAEAMEAKLIAALNQLQGE